MQTQPPFQQKATGQMTYPAKGTVNRFLFKSPVLWWRMGLGPILKPFMLLLTMWGRKSHLPRNTMLSYTLHDGKAYLISGWGERTDWYQNITADPHVTVQRIKNPYHAIARRVVDVPEYSAVMGIMLHTGGDTHFRPWLKSLGIAYDLDDLIRKRDRVYLVALDPTDQAGPPPMASDLKWVWGVVLIAAAVVWLIGEFTVSLR